MFDADRHGNRQLDLHTPNNHRQCNHNIKVEDEDEDDDSPVVPRIKLKRLP
jgi:hypothetical protein